MNCVSKNLCEVWKDIRRRLLTFFSFFIVLKHLVESCPVIITCMSQVHARGCSCSKSIECDLMESCHVIITCMSQVHARGC